MKQFLKKLSKKCPKCQAAYAKPVTQQLGILPPVRTTLARAFAKTGVDFAGQPTLREGSTRKPVHYKAYLCVFICMCIRAIHIEMCRELSTEAFMTTFRVNRRGTPEEVFCDHGANFVGTRNEMREIVDMLERAKHSIANYSAEQQVKWNFIPPRAPHFGGLCEAGVKAAKTQLRKLVAPHPLRVDELMVVLTEVEAVLNSRPLVAIDQTESEDELVLTPIPTNEGTTNCKQGKDQYTEQMETCTEAPTRVCPSMEIVLSSVTGS